MKTKIVSFIGFLLAGTFIFCQSILAQNIDIEKVDVDITMHGDVLMEMSFGRSAGVKDEAGVDCSVASSDFCASLLEVIEDLIEDPENGGDPGGGDGGNESGGEEPTDEDEQDNSESSYRIDESEADGNGEHLRLIRMLNSASGVSVNFWKKDGASKTKLSWSKARKKRALRTLIKSLKSS